MGKLYIKTYIQTMKNGTVAPPCVKFHVEIPSAVDLAHDAW